MSWTEEDLSLIRTFSLINLDRMFEDTPEARIVNNENMISQDLAREYNEQIFQSIDGELEFAPSCKCGATTGMMKEGLICPKCGSLCSSQFADVLTHKLWLSIPEPMPPVLHPIWYLILKQWTAFGHRKISVLDVLLNPELEIPEDFLPFLDPECKRGFAYFHDNVDEIFEIFLCKYPRTMKKPLVQWIGPMLRQYRDVLFTRHLPILNSSLHARKKNGETLTYVDQTSKDLLEAIIDMNAESYRQKSSTVSAFQSAKSLYSIYSKMIEYYNKLVKLKLGRKQGILRKHCYGSRIHHSFRAVVVPQAIPMPLDEILLPWGVIVNGLKPIILNFLMHRHNKTFNEAIEIFFSALVNYNELVDQCLMDYIKECPDGKGMVILGRNPTLAVGSILQLFYRDYKRDPHDETVGINACIVAPGNIGTTGRVICAA